MILEYKVLSQFGLEFVVMQLQVQNRISLGMDISVHPILSTHFQNTHIGKDFKISTSKRKNAQICSTNIIFLLITACETVALLNVSV